MSKAQKISVATVFAVIIINIIMGIMRNITIALGFRGINTTVTYGIDIVMECFEPGVALIVCSMPAYRVLLPNHQRRRDQEELQRHAATIGMVSSQRKKSTQTFEGDSSSREPQITLDMV